MTPENSKPNEDSFSQSELYKQLVPISGREQATRVIDVLPIYTSAERRDHTTVLERTLELREDLRSFLQQRPSEGELDDKLDDIFDEASRLNILNPLSNRDIYDQIMFQYEDMGYGKSEAVHRTTAELKADSYLPSLRRERRLKEVYFQEPISDATAGELTSEEIQKLSDMKEHTYDLLSLSAEQRQSLSEGLPGGNYLYHGAGTESLIKIIQDGQLMNYMGVYEQEVQRAAQEDRELNHPGRNSGYEGISWSMNTIDALPGDRYHMAGFLASPETVLRYTEQFAIPSRPAPHEVIQIDGGIRANYYYENKVQYELMSDVGMGETNSVFGSLVALQMALESFRTAGYEPGEAPYSDVPMMLSFIDKYSDEEIINIVKDKYHIDESGSIVFSVSLAEQRMGDEIPVLAVYLQELIDTGKARELKGFDPAPQTVREFVEAMTEKNIDSIIDEARFDRAKIDKKVEQDEKLIRSTGVVVEDMYFVCPQKDAVKWQLVFAKSGHMPKGILLYDGRKVRLENFASDVTGDAQELSKELREAIPISEGYIDYETQVLGTQITSDVRAGARHHVVGEEYLVNRKVIRKDDAGNLVIS